MSIKETVLRIFVASPSNVLDERDRLADVVDEVNSVMAKKTGVRLDLLRYEKDTSPDFGEDSQAVINRQIPQDYDIFICIMWHTVGSSTKRAESGTIEEYQLAKERYDQDPNSVRLMLYFKDAAPSSLSDIDPEQFGRVKVFRERVEDEGGFYATFTTTADFVNKVRRHLMRHVLEWDIQPKVTTDISLENTAKKSQPVEQFDDEQEPDDEGIIDLEEIIVEEMTSLSTVLKNMTLSMEEIRDNTNTRTEEVNALSLQSEKKPEDKERQVIRAELKRITKDTSGDMKRFVRRMNEDIPLFKQHLDRSLITLAKAIPIYKELNEDHMELKEEVTTLLEAHRFMLTSMEELHNAVVGLPKLSTALARSKKEMGRTVQEIINTTKSGIISLEDITSMLTDDN